MSSVYICYVSSPVRPVFVFSNPSSFRPLKFSHAFLWSPVFCLGIGPAYSTAAHRFNRLFFHDCSATPLDVFFFFPRVPWLSRTFGLPRNLFLSLGLSVLRTTLFPTVYPQVVFYQLTHAVFFHVRSSFIESFPLPCSSSYPFAFYLVSRRRRGLSLCQRVSFHSVLCIASPPFDAFFLPRIEVCPYPAVIFIDDKGLRVRFNLSP